MRSPLSKALIQLAALAAACLVGALAAENYALQATRTEAQAQGAEDLGALRARMESLVNSDVQLVRGLVSYVRARPDLTQEEFAVVAADLLSGSEGRIRNIALARDLVISHIYPLAGNEKALGLDYRKRSDQWPDVERAARENRIVIAGPLNLVQGGVGLIARLPVYRRAKPNGDPSLWGMVSTVIDFPAFLASADYDRYMQTYRLVLAGRGGTGPEGETFWGDPEVLADDAIRLTVNLVNGTWLLAGLPRAGWPEYSDNLALNLGGALVVFALGAFLILLSLRHDLKAAETRALLERAHREAVMAREAAQRASQAKSSFLATMSHEFRTPLNAIIGFSDVLKNQYFGPPGAGKYREYAGDILSSAEHLLELVNDLLDLSAIEAGRREITPQALPLAGIVADCVQTVQERARTKNLALTSDLTADLPPVLADRRAIKQVLLNLLTNAVKFARNGDAVHVSARADDGEILVEVADTGPGIDPGLVPFVTDPFNKGAQVSYTADKGWGLGLAISKSLVDLQKGRLVIESSPGIGTRVTVALPRAAAEPSA